MMKTLPKSSWAVMALILATTTVVTTALAGSTDEEAAVRAAVLDYVEGIYDVEPARIERSVHPELAKRGFGRREATDAYREIPMTFEQLVKLAGTYNADGQIPADAPKEVVIYEILDQTASVKLVAEWGIDYMHLAKYDGRWLIVNVMWQSHPDE